MRTNALKHFVILTSVHSSVFKQVSLNTRSLHWRQTESSSLLASQKHLNLVGRLDRCFNDPPPPPTQLNYLGNKKNTNSKSQANRARALVQAGLHLTFLYFCTAHFHIFNKEADECLTNLLNFAVPTGGSYG